MKTKELDEILDNAEMTTAEKRAAIMALNGQDVNSAKDKYAAEIESKNTEIATLKGSNEELTKFKNGAADYDDLKKFKADTMAKLENSKRIAYLKKLGFENGADLIEGKVDWSKAQYDDAKQEFTGIDVDSLKSNYGYLLKTGNDNNPNPAPKQQVQFSNMGGGSNPKPNEPTSMLEAVQAYYNAAAKK